MVDPPFLLAHLGIVQTMVAALVLGKLLLTTAAMMRAGVEARTAALAGTVLAQMGEFSFVLAGLDVTWGIITGDQCGLMLSVALASILTSSSLVAVTPGVLNLLARWLPLSAEQRRAMGTSGVYVFKPEVIVCGYGRVGAELVQILKNGGFSSVVVDINPAVVRDVRAAGWHAKYGDAGMEPVRVLEHGGVNQVVQSEFEVSLGFGWQVLRWLGVPAAEARTLVADERDGFYALDHASRIHRACRSTRHDEAATGGAIAAMLEQA